MLRNSIHHFSLLLVFLSLAFFSTSCKTRTQAPSGGVYADSPYIGQNYPSAKPEVDEEPENRNEPIEIEEEAGPNENEEVDEYEETVENEEVDEYEEEDDGGPRELSDAEIAEQERALYQMQRSQEFKRNLGRFGLVVIQLAMDIGIWWLLTQ